MATDYGGIYGRQPWHGAQPPRPGRPDHGRPAQPGSPPPPGFPLRRRRARFLAVTVLVLGLAGFAASVAGLANQVLHRKLSASQMEQITNWEYGKRWRTLPADAIFPASVSYPPPAGLYGDPALTLAARRVGVAGQASCAAAADPTAAAVLDHDGCQALLRATYVDDTDSYVVTVGAAVLPGSAQAAAAARTIAHATGADGLGPAVRTVRFAATPAAGFTDSRRQLSGVVSAGTYVVLYTVGYADERPREPVAGDTYTDDEMSSAGTGVAHAVLSVLAAPVPAPSCPGTPGCTGGWER